MADARLALLLLLAAPGVARAEKPSAMLAALAAVPDGDLVYFSPHRKGAPVELELGAAVGAPAEKVVAMLADPQAYRRAVPAFVRAETLRTDATHGGPRPGLWLAWELEIPLWNLEGHLWLWPRTDGATLELTSGDLAPGRFRLTVVPRGRGSWLLIQGGADIKNANWITRRLASRHAHAEPAMAVAAAYVLLRALALEAERAPSRWPTSPLRAPPLAELDSRGLARAVAALPPLPPAGALALVRSRADGRLRSAQIALRAPPERLTEAFGRPDSWRALPGWKEVEVRSAAPLVWEVDSMLPFVDFDSVWTVTPQPRFRAAARGGDWRGAVMGWDLLPPPRAAAGGSVAVFSSHPHVERTGYLPRKLIDAEPLLEHGLALGLAYVNALSFIEAVQAEQDGP
jgi:hypothetical protein